MYRCVLYMYICIYVYICINIYIYIHIHICIHLETLNGCIKSNTCPQPVSWKTTLEKQLKNAESVKGSPFLKIKLKLSDIYIVI